MNWFTGTIIYLTMWWIVLFCVLPFGARSQAEMGDVVEGTDPGAPVVADIKQKLIWTSLITAVVWGLFYVVVSSGWISLARPLGKFGPG